MRRKPINMTLVLGIVFIAIAAIAVGAAMIGSKPDKVALLVPKEDVGAYRVVSADQLEVRAVNDDPVYAGALTAAAADKAAKEGTPLFSTRNLPAGQPVMAGSFGTDANAALATVSADETLVGVSTTLPGALLGVLQPGNVVDVVTLGSGSGSGAAAQFAKVIAIGDDDAAKGVAGVSAPVKAGKEGSGKGIMLVLAVSESQADALAGTEVAMVMRPFCQVSGEGLIVPRNEDSADACRVPAGRAAAGDAAISE